MYEFDNDEDRSGGLSQVGTNIMSLIVRVFGFALLLAGLWVAFYVLMQAMELYKNPTMVEKLAVHIERGSNIDSSLASVRESDGAKTTNNGGNIRISYFFAWMIILLLLLLIGRISLTAVKTGGELVLYDVHIKRFARELAKQSHKGPE